MPRDVSPILQYIRKFLLMREGVNMLRFPDKIAKRTQPPPIMPEGPNAKLAGNYYYTRDARRLVTREEIILDGPAVLKLPGEKVESGFRAPGKIHNWDL